MKKINKKEVNNLKVMPIADRVLFFMEYLCYLFTIVTLIVSILFIRYSIRASFLLLLICMGLILCAIECKKNRDCFFKHHKKIIIDKNYEIINLNRKALKY